MSTIWPILWDIVKVAIIPFCLWYFQKKMDERDRDLVRRDDRREREYAERKKQQDLKDKMIMRGLKTISDCQYEVVYQMQTGKHNGGLEQCLEDITNYRADVNEWIVDRASKNN